MPAGPTHARTRTPVERRYVYLEREYEVRVQPQSIDRVTMVLREVSKDSSRSDAQPMMRRHRIRSSSRNALRSKRDLTPH